MNKATHCKKMIEEKRYLIKNSKGSEDMWLCKYLKDNGYDFDKAFDVWIDIYRTRCEFYSFEAPLAQFRYFWSKCDKVKFDNKRVIVYDDEIEFIKRLDLKYWQKKFVLAMLVYYRRDGKTEVSELNFPPKKLMKYIKRADRHADDGNDLDALNSVLEDAGIVKRKTKKVLDRVTGEYDEYGFYEIVFKTKRKKIVFDNSEQYGLGDDCLIIDDWTDIDYDEMLPNTAICSVCGEEFVVKERHRNVTMCDSCYYRVRLDIKNSHRTK